MPRKRGYALPKPVELDTIPVRMLADAGAVRRECGGVSRPTLLVWRREQAFPAPVKAQNLSFEVWDLRAVRKWHRRRLRASESQ